MAIPINTISKSIVLQPGEPFVLPSGAEITFVSDSNSLTSDCATFPATGPSICYTIEWYLDTGGGAGVWDPVDTKIINMILGNGVDINLHEMEGNGGINGPGGQDSDLYDALSDPNTTFPGTVVRHYAKGSTGARTVYALDFQAPAIFGEDAYITFRIFTGEDAQYFRAMATPCDDCCGSGSSS